MAGIIRSHYTATITSDAPVHGIVGLSRQWVSGSNSNGRKDINITIKELLPVVVSVAMWVEQLYSEVQMRQCSSGRS